MSFSRRLTAIFAFVALLAPAPAFAGAKDAVFNKEHVWAIDADGDACAVSRTLDDGSVFLFRAQDGALTFGYFPRKPMKAGRAGRFETEAYSFDFAPSFENEGTSLFFNGDFNARAVAALRLAREVRVLVDGRLVTAMTFEGTGFESALDGVIACSRGASGWWGKGVGAPPADNRSSPDRQADPFVFNKEGDWAIAVSDAPGVCIAQARVDEHSDIQVLAALGRLGLAVRSDADLPRGRRGKLETDSYTVDFTPGYHGKGYVSSSEPFDSATIFALHRAKRLRLGVDGHPLAEVDLTGSGFADLLDSVAACSKGEKGWWGAGATQSR